jgi:hypothetical protein
MCVRVCVCVCVYKTNAVNKNVETQKEVSVNKTTVISAFNNLSKEWPAVVNYSILVQSTTQQYIVHYYNFNLLLKRYYIMQFYYCFNNKLKLYY